MEKCFRAMMIVISPVFWLERGRWQAQDHEQPAVAVGKSS
jgi:hypothetical protein